MSPCKKRRHRGVKLLLRPLKQDGFVQIFVRPFAGLPLSVRNYNNYVDANFLNGKFLNEP